ncbi:MULTISPECIES: hypothetical protein [unclassified Moorena]|nr:MULTISPECIES: hypothetical protein [unclassified Moorena]
MEPFKIGNRESGIGNRESGIGNRESGKNPVYLTNSYEKGYI